MKDGGIAALTEAERRADAATYQEVKCRSALNRVKGMPFEWTLNPYRGCTHACHYCFARRYHTQFELDADDQFSSVILVKTNLVDVLTRELDRLSWHRELVALGTATDPYQPIEGHYRLTRGALEALARAKTPVGLVTKGPMVVRDLDLLRAVGDASSCTVYVSVPSVDEDAWRKLEPGTASPLQRLRAVRSLVDGGVNAGVLMAPLVPGITTDPRLVERTIAAIAGHGARFVGANVLYLEGGTRTHFLEFLGREYPDLSEAYGSLYAGSAKYVPRDFSTKVQDMVRGLRARYGMSPRESKQRAGRGTAPEVVPPQGAAGEQREFSWSM